jgi:hypothetical protein
MMAGHDAGAAACAESLKAPKNPGARNRRTRMAGVITGEPQSGVNPVLGNGVRAGQA